MVLHLLRKCIYGLSVLIGVVVLVFFLFQGFGDPARLVLGQSGDSATLQNIRKELALDAPKHKQLLYYMNDVSPLSIYRKEQLLTQKHLSGVHSIDLGSYALVIKAPYLRTSYQTKQPVTAMIAHVITGTILLAVTAMLLATIIGICLGTIAAIKKDTWMDTAAITMSVAGISAPSFFVGIIVAYVFGFLLHDYTGLDMTGSLYRYDIHGKHIAWRNLILPALTLGVRPMAIIAQLTRSAMLDVLKQDYIRTAIAKGLPMWRVLLKHALRNALNPVITAITGWFAELLAGAFFVEYIFGWQGIGKLTVEALERLDFPVVMGSVLVTACFFIVMNLLADVLYGLVDPRVRY
ncbi:MAG TPA: ABC transporter permease [Chitinophagaceae bacterium]|nr:ABC transporter permease [Chitinophagaceae bacterium]